MDPKYLIIHSMYTQLSFQQVQKKLESHIYLPMCMLMLKVK